jgi:polyisoprenoid-binding protein YceI
MCSRRFTTAILLLVASAPTAFALGRASDASVTVLAHGPAGLRVDGKSRELSVEDDGTTLTFKVPLAPIDTGIGLRNRHMRESLEAERFPVALLRVPKAEIAFPRDGAPTQGTVRGELTLHGQSHPALVRYQASRDGTGKVRVHGSLHLDLRDFAVNRPSYLGVTVAPEVEITVEAVLEDA